MGATAAIGAGLSVVSGISGANQQRKQASAQKKAIQAQAEVEQLNSRLQLISLQNQQALATTSDLLNRTLADQQYSSRVAQLNQQELTNQLAVSEARLQANTGKALAQAEASSTTTQALTKLTTEQGKVGQQLVEAIANSGAEQSQYLKQLQSLPEQQRASAISAFMDLAAASGGTNEALKLLGELEPAAYLGKSARAEESQQLKSTLAQTAADSASAALRSQLTTTEAQANVGLAQTTYAADSQDLDARTSLDVATQAFASERTAAKAAYDANSLASSLETSARTANAAAQKEVLERGATLSAATASANSAAVRSPGFFDYLSVGMQGASTYTNLGGSWGFLQPKSGGSSAIRRGVDNTGALSSVA